LRIAQMSGQFNIRVEWTVRSTPQQRVAVRAHEKSGGLCKIPAVWTVYLQGAP